MIQNYGIQPTKIAAPVPGKGNGGVGAAELTKQFGDFLNDAMNQIQEQQQTVDQLNTQFIKGETSDVHQLTIAAEKASLGLELTVQVRNKMIEAYQEIMRMQI